MKGIDEMQAKLETVAKRSLPFAARQTVNGLAFAGRKLWQEEMASSLTLRNKFTQRRALVERARGLRISRMHAVLGHTEDYMEKLETGRPEVAKKTWRPIPTEVAAGQARKTLSTGRKRAVRPKNIISRLGNLRTKGASGLSRKARNALAVRQAIKSGRRLAFLDLGRRKGIYRIIGQKVWKLYDLSKRVTRMPRIPTLDRTVKKTLTQGPRIAHEALAKQLKRAGVRGY